MALVFGCGRCKMPLKGPSGSQPDSRLSCLVCGESDTFENVQRIIGEFLKEYARDQIGDMLRDATSRSYSMTFKETPRPKGVYRFVAVEDGH